MQRVLDLASPERSARRDRALGATLAFVAGAINAGGFLAVGQYTSHMTGIVSTIGDDMALGRMALVGAAVAALAAFLFGAMTTAITVNWARRRQLRSHFAMPLLLEAVLLAAFGVWAGALGAQTVMAPAAVLLLCFMMGLQNAVITKVSKAEIRTTHVTGLVTDIGIELGRMVYVNRLEGREPVRANRQRLGVHLLLFGCFLGGSVLGAFGFHAWGSIVALPLAAVLVLIGLKPLAQDLRNAPGA